MAIENVVFKYGSKAAYDGLAVKDTNTIYWLTDVGKIFRGTVDFSRNTEVLAALPTPAEGKQGIIYVILGAGDPELYIFNGTVYVPLMKAYVTAIGATSTDAQVPTAKAVVDYVGTEIGNLKDEVEEMIDDIDLSGFVKNPTYDSTYRKITLPIEGGAALEINLGKDLVVQQDGSVYDDEEKELVLTITDGTEIRIPVADLVPIFNFINTDTMAVVVNYNTTTKKTDITIDLKLSAAEGNTAEVKTDGLFIGGLKWEPIV